MLPLIVCLLVVAAIWWLVPAREAERPPGGPRVLVVTGSYGAGHDAAAARVVRELAQVGRRVELVDVVDAYPLGAGRLLRRLYFAQLATCPRSWDWILSAMARSGRSGRAARRMIGTTLAVLAHRGLARHLDDEVDLVVSTHPFASAALARMRRRGELSAAVATYLTDPSVHRLWVHDGVDAHLAIYPEAARQARDLGAHRVTLIEPLVPPTATSPRRPKEAAAGTPVALVVGGSEGVGDLLATAEEIVGSGLATPVVVCGHNLLLLEQAAALPGAIALPWQEDLAAVIAGADVVVQNAGGSTALEALAAGTPVVSHRCIPGHGTDNAAALAVDGLAPWTQSTGALVDALTDALVADRTPPADWLERPSLVDVLLGDPAATTAHRLLVA